MGNYYQKRKKKISSAIEIVAFLDNNFQLYEKMIDGAQVLPPDKIQELSYDKIVLMSINGKEMQEQLIKLGVSAENIWSWEQLNSEMWHGIFRFYAGNTGFLGRKSKILFISTDLNYNGGTLAAAYAAFALQCRGFDVVLAAQAGNSKFIDEMTDNGINIVICPGFPGLKKEEIFFIKQFDLVIVNVFQMILCACEISKIRPTMWWIHEPSMMYRNTKKQFYQYMDIGKLKRISIYAVSSIAQKNFNYYFPKRIQKTLSYGIPDQKIENIHEIKRERLVFAMIGAVCPIKAQDIFIQAVQLLNDEDKKNIQCWIIGSIGNDEYSSKVRELASKEISFKLWGELTRKELQNIYEKINVVVCPSREDCLPVTITEGLMLQKICIVSDHTGSADYIVDGINGFIVPTGDVIALKKKIEWVIENRGKHQKICENARKTYEKYFTMDAFGYNLENAMKETVEYWNLNSKL